MTLGRATTLPSFCSCFSYYWKVNQITLGKLTFLCHRVWHSQCWWKPHQRSEQLLSLTKEVGNLQCNDLVRNIVFCICGTNHICNIPMRQNLFVDMFYLCVDQPYKTLYGSLLHIESPLQVVWSVCFIHLTNEA